MVTAPRPIPDAVRATQARASDPAASAFVSANAGSGKTHVLVQRVIRLLLSGVPPEKILCITFTKAAAANMAERVFATLGHWVTLDDDALDDAIARPASRVPTPACAMRARELFACALETPGGLKVQTIHALCTRLLQQFPFEANVPARFAVLDDRDQNAMMERANLAVLLEAVARSRQRRGPRARSSPWRVPPTSPSRTWCARPASAAITSWPGPTRAGGADAAATQMSAALGVDPGDRIEDVERDDRRRAAPAEIAMGGNRRRSSRPAATTDQDQAERLREALVFPAARRSTNISACSSPMTAHAAQIAW